MDCSFYSFYWLDSLEIWLDHNSTYYRSLSKHSDVKRRISHCDPQNLQYKTHPEFWPSHRRIFKTSLYYKTCLILETRRYINNHRNWGKISIKCWSPKRHPIACPNGLLWMFVRKLTALYQHHNVAVSMLSLYNNHTFVDSLVPGKFEWKFLVLNFPDNFSDWWLRYLLWTGP